MTKKNDDAVAYSYELFIGAPAERVWEGLTNGELTKHYVFGTKFEGDLTPGAPYAFVGDGGFRAVDGRIVESLPGKRLVLTWSAHWDEAVGADRPSRVRYELAPSGAGATKLSVVHDDFDGETATYKGSVEGWPAILSSLKTLLETGKPLAVGGP